MPPLESPEFAAAAAAGMPGSPDELQQGIGTTQGNPRAAVDPGPQNPAIAEQFPAALSPPATDVGDLPQFWASFNNAPAGSRLAAGRGR